MANMRKCPKCGKIENSYTYFCTECGTKTVDYVDNGSNQQTSNVSVDKPIKKSDFSTDGKDGLRVENARNSDVFDDGHQNLNTQKLQSQNVQPVSELHQENNAPITNGSNKVQSTFKWNKKYTYICVALGACLILGFVISQVNKSNKSQDADLNYANEDADTGNFDSPDAFSEDSNSGVSNQNESNSDEEENTDSFIYDVDVESIVSDIREKYNSIVEGINESDYYFLTYPNGASAYFEGENLRAIRVPRNINNSPYAKYYYYDNDNELFFAYYESTDAHRLYFENEELVRWRYCTDASNPQDAINYELVRDADYNQMESDVLNDSASYIQYITNTEGFNATDYILPSSDSRYIDKDELENFTPDECRLARNELYARHGRMFTDESLQSFFDSKDWYSGYISPDDWDENSLNEYEFYNRDLIVEYEKEMGYR